MVWFRIVYENQRFSQEYSISRSLEATKRTRWISLAVDLSTKRHKVDWVWLFDNDVIVNIYKKISKEQVFWTIEAKNEVQNLFTKLKFIGGILEILKRVKSDFLLVKILSSQCWEMYPNDKYYHLPTIMLINLLKHSVYQKKSMCALSSYLF